MSEPREPVTATVDVEHSPDAPGGRIADDLNDLAPIRRYALLERLGEGGMGVVYSAYDARLDRKVAIKVLRHERSAAARARFTLEAQALAKLEHPNVVAVFDAGEVDERPYIAMALVEGAALSAWLRERPRTWREIAAVFVAAGKGLAAAHAAGVVHRDVKPGNVLVGRDGSVRVADFGLARVAGNEADEGERRMGTPRYMAPEQRLGESDARSDQYSFCVALREALEGVSGPAFLGKIADRGTQDRPEARYPDMDALLADLSYDPARRWRRVALTGAVAVAMAGLVAVAVRVAVPDEVCTGAADKLDGVWDPSVKEKTRAAFLGSGSANAADAWQRVERALDGYARDWVAMHTEACAATAVRHEQSEAMLDRRQACLERRRAGLSGLTMVLSRPLDAPAVDRAVEAAIGLEDLAACADLDALGEAYPPSHDPRVAALELRIAEARALQGLGRFSQAEAAGVALYAEAPAIDHPPTRARALAVLPGTAAERVYHSEATLAMMEAALRMAIMAASAARMDDEVARRWADLVVILTLRRRTEAALELRLPIESAIERAGRSPLLAAYAEDSFALALRSVARLDESIDHAARAVGLVEQAVGPDDLRLRPYLETLAMAIHDAGRGEEARAVMERALAITERALGPHHSYVAMALEKLASAHQASGRFDRAQAALERALVIFESVEGVESSVTMEVVGKLGIVATLDERYEEAIPYLRRSAAWAERRAGPESADLAGDLVNLGQAELQFGELAAARASLERALVITKKVLPPGHPQLGLVTILLALASLEEGDPVTAEARARAGLEILEAKLGADHPFVGAALQVVGRALLARGKAVAAVPLLEREVRLEEKAMEKDSLALASGYHYYGASLLAAGRVDAALPWLEHAVAIRSSQGTDLMERGPPRLTLARALWAKDDRARARQLAGAALADFQKSGPRGQARAAEAQAWLAAHL